MTTGFGQCQITSLISWKYLGISKIVAMKADGRYLLIRADGGGRIGTGHVMRCIALAQAWQDVGGQVAFLSNCKAESLRRRIEEEDFKFIPILKSHPHPGDLAQTLKFLSTIPEPSHTVSSWVVLDGYHFGTEYQRRIREAGHMLLVIDDMAHLDSYDAEIILNQNTNAARLCYSCGPNTNLLLGTQYVLLRKEFFDWKGWKRTFHLKPRKILVTLGGSDPNNVTLKVIKALYMLSDSDFEVRVVIGPSNPHYETLKNESQHVPCGVRLLTAVKNMPDLMAWADVAVSVAGSTCWELAFMGLPAVLLILADNQESIAEDLNALGCVLNLGRHTKVDPRGIAEALSFIMNRKHRLEAMSKKARSLIDGRGSLLAISTIQKLSEERSKDGHYRIRPSELQDARLLWQWANDPVMRVNAFRSGPIPFDHHLKWYQRKLNSSDSCIWILESGELPVAQVRYDRIGPAIAEIDIYVEPNLRGRGIGSRLLEETAFAACRVLGVQQVRAVVISQNVASAKAFQKAGFMSHGEEEISGRRCFIFTWHPVKNGKKYVGKEVNIGKVG